MMNMDITIINPSYLTRQNIPANTNENKINFFWLLKKSASVETTKKINMGSVIPTKEFSMILGSKIKNKGAIKAISFLMNLLAKKYIGIEVITEKNIDKLRWINMKSKGFSEFVSEKNNERKVGHKLFAKSWVVGKLLVTLKSIPYQKYDNESKANGISNGKNIYLKMNPPLIIKQK